MRPLPGRVRASRGTALVAALLLVMLLSAVGLGLALSAGLEPLVVANFEGGLSAGNAADAAVMLVAHDLAALGDWSLALNGSWSSESLDAAPPPDFLLPDGSRVTLAGLTSVANCGRTAACTPAEEDAVTRDRPWGTNNPHWRLAGVVRWDRVSAVSPGLPIQTAVWIGDDPAETDGDPQRDGGPNPADPAAVPRGRDCVLVRAEAFGARGAHRVVVAHVSRPGAAASVRVRPWAPR